MLISMPTDTSTILGAFQVILFSLEIRRELRTEAEPKTASDIAQARKIESRTPADQAYRSIFLSKTRQFLFWTRPSRGFSKFESYRCSRKNPNFLAKVSIAYD